MILLSPSTPRIVTIDKCKAELKSIRTVFPMTYVQLCMFHVKQIFMEKLKYEVLCKNAVEHAADADSLLETLERDDIMLKMENDEAAEVDWDSNMRKTSKGKPYAFSKGVNILPVMESLTTSV